MCQLLLINTVLSYFAQRMAQS